MSTTINIPIGLVRPNPMQPRKTFKKETLQEMAQSIKEHGVVQPIIVEESESGGWVLVDGERRLRASKLAGMTTIEAVIRQRSNHNGRELLLSAIIANVQREDMNPIDEAKAYQALNDEHGLSAHKIAAKVGRNTKRIYDMLKLLKLEAKVQDLIRDGRMSHDIRLVEALLKMPNAEMQVAFAERVVKGGLKLKAIYDAAEDFCKAVNKPLGIRKNQTPALVIARRDSENEEKEPPRWNALVQIGKVPAWPLIATSAKVTCATCELRDMANHSTCGRCPLVAMLEGLMEAQS